jgi:hypothetical protein
VVLYGKKTAHFFKPAYSKHPPAFPGFRTGPSREGCCVFAQTDSVDMTGMGAEEDHDRLPMMSREDYERIGQILREIGGHNVTWGSQAHLDVWMVEHQIRAERLTNSRLTRATWGLFFATGALVLATIALVLITFLAACPK